MQNIDQALNVLGQWWRSHTNVAISPSLSPQSHHQKPRFMHLVARSSVAPVLPSPRGPLPPRSKTSPSEMQLCVLFFAFTHVLSPSHYDGRQPGLRSTASVAVARWGNRDRSRISLFHAKRKKIRDII